MSEEFKKRTFQFNEQESYSIGEVENILNQHSTFLAGATKKELEDLKGQVTTLKKTNDEFSAKEKNRMVKKLAKGISEDNYEKLMKYTKISEDATEDEIKIALEETNKDFSNQIVQDTSKPKVETTKTVVETVKPSEKEDKFAGL